MSFDVTALAQGGAQVIATAMATDAWDFVRDRLGRLLNSTESRSHGDSLVVLDDTYRALETGTRTDAEVELRQLLRQRLTADSDLAAPLAVLVEEIRAEIGVAVPRSTVSQSAQVSGGGMVIQAGRDVYGGGRGA